MVCGFAFGSAMWTVRAVICSAVLLATAAMVPADVDLADNIKIRVDNLNQHTVYSILRDGAIVQSVRLADNFGQNISVLNLPDGGVILNGNGPRIEVSVVESQPGFTLFRVSRNLTAGTEVIDCLNLDSTRLSWYGGPQQKKQYWPIEKLTFNNYSYLSKEADNCGVAERYWLNSDGSFIYVDEQTPLFLNQNINGNTLCFMAKKELPYDRYARDFTFIYHIGVSSDARRAHLEAVRTFLKKPTGTPDELMVRHPIWSTWARYKRDINETTVLQFADEILRNKFNNSQFEIDDDWEVCYGALTFRQSKFPNTRNLTNALKAKGFRVTLWIHPFINKGCDPWYTEAKQNGYLVVDHNNNSDTQWWNSERGQAAHVDFTNPKAADWFTKRLEAILRDTGIDSFKFDAGETSWAPQDPKLNGTPNLHPTSITIDYLRTVGKFGPMVEVRSGHGTQDLPIFTRIIDKDSLWTWSNGLPTLITTLLQANMVGYGFILPDMIGGNGYEGAPDKELFIRWLQANVFMPSLQFSYTPMDYDAETIAISHKFTKLHEQYTDKIMRRFRLAVAAGEPVNPPLWWIDPQDRVAQQINDQFLLGDNIVVAPVIEKGAVSRHVYLPRGHWIDGNTKVAHIGPKWLMDHAAPLDILPYFERQRGL